MIHVEPQPEPNDFDTLVRKPGQKFLKAFPKATPEEIDKHPYWREILQELHTSYRGICAYSCHYIHRVTGNKNVEHFKPKALFRDQAYEWSNYRLVCGLLNTRKRVKEVLDPFEIEDGWFCLHFPSLQVHPAPELPDELKSKVQETIDILKLNHEGDCIPARRACVESYCAGKVNFAHLEDEAPFLAKELSRQKAEEEIKLMWQSAAPSRSVPASLRGA